MIMMQYKIELPHNFDMDNIRKRVKENGFKTDGFEDLIFKAYLISEETNKEYSPLYIWGDSKGMNKFIFEGFYDNILNSFGWQKIQTGIPLLFELEEKFSQSKYLMEIENRVEAMEKMKKMEFSVSDPDILGKVLVYNPSEWKSTEYYFYSSYPQKKEEAKIYEILHISK